MNNVHLIAGLIVVSILLFQLYRWTSYPYKKQPRLMTKTESYFFKGLIKTLEPSYRIHCSVRVADVISVRGKFSSNRRSFYMISSKQFDFVITSPDASTIHAAIELDDKTHERRDRKKRDAFLDKACRAAGLDLYRFPVASRYNFQGLLSELNANQSAVSKLVLG